MRMRVSMYLDMKKCISICDYLSGGAKLDPSQHLPIPLPCPPLYCLGAVTYVSLFCHVYTICVSNCAVARSVATDHPKKRAKNAADQAYAHNNATKQEHSNATTTTPRGHRKTHLLVLCVALDSQNAAYGTYDGRSPSRRPA